MLSIMESVAPAMSYVAEIDEQSGIPDYNEEIFQHREYAALAVAQWREKNPNPKNPVAE